VMVAAHLVRCRVDKLECSEVNPRRRDWNRRLATRPARHLRLVGSAARKGPMGA
jgi:hypothetical protein